MTIASPEGNQQNILKQEQVDANLQQTKVDTNLNQQTQGQEKTKTLEDDENFKSFREGRKKDRIEREAAEKRAIEKEAEVAALKAAMEAAFTAKPSYQQHQYIEPNEESEDQRIEKKVNAIIAQRESAIAKQKYEQEMQEYPNRLANEYQDFHQVISQENRDYLDYHFPEVSHPLSELPEGYNKWKHVYKAIKKLVPNHSTAKKESAKAEINQAKPRSISGATVTQPAPVTGSHILSEEKKAANWARMQAIRNGVG